MYTSIAFRTDAPAAIREWTLPTTCMECRNGYAHWLIWTAVDEGVATLVGACSEHHASQIIEQLMSQMLDDDLDDSDLDTGD